MRLKKKRIMHGLVSSGLILTFAAIGFAQQAPPATGTETELLAVLQSDAPLFDKAKACQQLAVIGTRESVPVLAQLLSDEQLAHYARYSLEPIPDPSVDEALRSALGTLKGGLLVGVINSIGMRRDAASTRNLSQLLADSDPAVAAAAASALGRLASTQSVAILKEALSKPEPLKSAVGDACLTAGDTLARQGQQAEAIALFEAIRQADVPRYMQLAALSESIRTRGAEGLELLVEQLQSADEDQFAIGLSMAHRLPGEGVTKALVAQLERPMAQTPSPNPRHARVIAVLAQRGDKAALPAVLKVAADAPEDVRLPALRALATIGNASAVPLLLDTALANQGEISAAALTSLAELPGNEADQQIEKLLAGSQGQARQVLIELVGLREISSAVPALLKLLDNEDPQTSQAALASLGLTIGLDNLPTLVQQMLKATSPETAAAAKAALQKACLRMPDRDATSTILVSHMERAPIEAKSELLDLLGVVGGAKALANVAAAAKSEDEQLVDAATRVLGQWMSADAAPVLLELAQSGNDKFKVRSLRGYIRIPRQLNVSLEERIAMCEKALQVATRDQELEIILKDVLARCPSTKALDLVMPYLQSSQLKDAAAASATDIANEIVNTDPAAAAAAMKQVLETTQDADVKRKARRVLNRSKQQ